VLLDRANIRIDVIYTLLSSRAKAFFDLVALLLTLVFVGWLTSSVFQLLGKSFGSDSMTVGTVIFPLWIPQFAWACGYALFTLTALYLSIRSLGALLRRDWADVNRIAGVPSVAEVVEEETHLDAETISNHPRHGGVR
jgi:TRAP-type C4-dicarboxylate transport system permease small subunit